jgi:hypothetical protein
MNPDTGFAESGPEYGSRHRFFKTKNRKHIQLKYFGFVFVYKKATDITVFEDNQALRKSLKLSLEESERNI